MDALTLDQVRVFLSVVDEGSFPKAAKSLQRAQSAVTYAIRKLEAEIGVPLFDRSAYRSVLTPAGRALLTRARHWVPPLTWWLTGHAPSDCCRAT